MKLTREKLRRMFDQNTGQVILGGGGGDVDLTGIATEAWVEENYLSKAFFARLFKAYGPAETEGDPDVEVEPNDLESNITSIEAMFGFWTQQYISALGQGSGGGGGGGGSDTLADLIDVELTNPVSGQVLKYNGTKWINSAASTGTVTRVAMSVPTGFAVTGSPITVSGVISLSFADGYSLPTTAKQTNWDAAYSWTSVSRTTLADYGITDAKFGTPGTDSIPITLGSTTQSVLTQHQSLANYYTKSETDGKFLTISFFRSLFRAYTSSNAEVQPNDGSTSTIASIKAMFGFWTEQYLSALGQSSGGGGGVTLNQPLQGINQAGLSAPTTAGQILVYNGTKWAYAGNISITNLTAYAGTFNSGVSAVGSFTSQGGNFIAQNGGYIIQGADNSYVLLAGGDKSKLKTVNGYSLFGEGNIDASGGGTGNYLPLAGGILNNYNTGWIFGATTSSSNAHASAYLAYSGGYGMWVGVSTTDTSHYLAEFRKGTTGFGAGGSTVFYIRADGKIGVNTSSPEYDFDIRGGLYVKTAKAIIDETTNGIQIKTVANTMIAALRGGASTPVAGGEYGIFQLYHGDVEKIRMYATGDSWITESLGIGTTSPAYKLDVRGDVAVGTPGTSGIIGCAYADNNNNFYNYIKFNSGSGGMQYYGGKFASGTSTVAHQFFTTSNDPALTIINSTYVGIGTTSPSHKLHVNGSVRIGDAVLVWDSTNGALKVQKSDGTAASFYATGAVSALGQSSSGTTYLDQATADGRYLKLSGGQTMTGSFSGTSITLSSQMKSTNAVATAYLTVGTSSLSTSYTLYVNGNAGINHIVIGNEQQVNTVNCAVIQTLSSRGIYIKSGSAPNYVDGTWANASDIRLKDIVSNAGASVEQVANAPVFNYKWKAGGTQVMLGTSAQYWKNVFNFGVSEGPDSYLYMDYASIALASAVMVARKVQSHEERIAALEALSNRQGKEIVSLRAENERLINEINELKTA